MSFTDEQLQTIRERSPIVEVVGARLKLRKQGRNHIGCCPFHQEKTPSFSVSAEKGVYYCFGCHASGDVFSFIMRHDGVDFPAAVRALAASAGVSLGEEDEGSRRRREALEALEQVNALALQYFTGVLGHPSGKPAQVYLAQREIPSKQAHERQLGYGGPHGGLAAYLRAHAKGDSSRVREQAVELGLIAEDGDRGLFDGRLIFPIFAAANQVIGFGGRRLEDSGGGGRAGDGAGRSSLGPKYINSKESELFSKRTAWYGWERALGPIRQRKRAVVVEGYTDVLACERGGVAEAIATLGTALSDTHIKRLKGLAEQVVLLLDGDAAGERAVAAMGQTVLKGGLRALVAWLPAGEDPDTLVRKGGGGALRSHLDDAVPLIEGLMQRWLKDGAAVSVETRAATARQLLPLIEAMGPGLERELYLTRLSQKVGVSSEQLVALARTPDPVRKGSGQRSEPRRNTPGRSSSQSTPHDPRSSQPPLGADGRGSLAAGGTGEAGPPQRLDDQEMAMLRELLLYPEQREQWADVAEYLTNDRVRSLLEALVAAEDEAASILRQHLDGTPWLARLARITPVGEAMTEDERRLCGKQTVQDILNRAKWRHLDLALREVIEELRNVEREGGETEAIIRRKRDLTRRKMALRRSMAGSKEGADGHEAVG